MPEPMSSDEIEDVLSSIRRLVAQDGKPVEPAKAAEPAAPKLVLAPELRVSDAPAPFTTVRQASPRVAFPPVDMVLPGVAALTDTHARSDDDDEAPAAAYTPPPAAPQPQPQSLPPQPAPAAAEQGWVLVAPAAAPAPAAAAAPAAAEAQPTPDPTPEAKDTTAPEAPAPMQWRDSEPDVVDTFHIIEAGQTNADQALQGTIEPDAAWADAAEQRVIAELAGQAVAEEVLDQIDEANRSQSFAPRPNAAPEVLFDEVQLRSLVQSILREELAGDLGERITRNIRKLVRAEVGRMMAVHELE